MSETYYVTTNGTMVTGSGYTPDGTLPAGAIPCTEQHAAAAGPWSTVSNGVLMLGSPPGPTLVPAARAALDASDVTVLRCYEHGIPLPAEWQSYRAALRPIAAGTSSATVLPAMPAYPAGT